MKYQYIFTKPYTIRVVKTVTKIWKIAVKSWQIINAHLKISNNTIIKLLPISGLSSNIQ